MNTVTPDQIMGALIVLGICVAMFAVGMDKPRDIKKDNPSDKAGV